MGYPRLVVFVRHAESLGNTLTVNERAKLSMPAHEYPLTERGKKQATITGHFLRKEFGLFDAYFSSYYTRTLETMKIMYPDASIIEDSRLAEASRGIWHTMTEEEVWQQFPKEIERKQREGLYHYRALGGGENWPDTEMRALLFCERLKDYSEKVVLVMIHGNWFLSLRRGNDGVSIKETLRQYQENLIKNCSIYVYQGVVIKGISSLLPMEEGIVPWEGKV